MKKDRRKIPQYLYFILAVLMFLAFLSFLFIPQSHQFYILANTRLENALAEKEYITNILETQRMNVAGKRYDTEDIGLNTDGNIKKIELRGQSVGFSPEEDQPFSDKGMIVTVIEQ